VAFRGTFDHTFDAKNRLTIPSKFRAVLANGVVVSMPTDQQPCLAIWRPEDHDSRTAETLALLPPHSPEAANLRRWLFGNSHETELDSAGRVMVPSFLIERASLGREVVITGAGDSLEVWNREAWSQYNDTLAPEINTITSSLGHPA
jgi:MraZ protein